MRSRGVATSAWRSATSWYRTAAPEDVRALLEELPDDAIVCTHREVIEGLFDGELTCEKGGAWLLERHNGRVEPTAYFPPPSVAVRPSERAASPA